MLNSSSRQGGFTLVEMIIGIVVLAIALGLISSILGPMFVRGQEPWQQVRAAELGHSLMNEIMARQFDENSPVGTSLLRCGEAGALACIATIPACPANGPSAATEEASRDLYDDVDDFHCFSGSGGAVTNILNQQLASSYSGFSVQVLVSYAGADLGLANNSVKRIDLTVTTPLAQQIHFRSYRGNW